MSIFDSMKVNLFSEMNGVVTLEGEPVAGALITRSANPDNDREYTDSAKTDNEGQFHFDRMETRMFAKLLPSQKSVSQKVIIEHEGRQYLAWEAITSDTDKGELNEMDVIGTDKELGINVKCELTAAETKKAGAYITVITGICSWDGQKLLE